MFYLFATGAALSFAFGTFFTKGSHSSYLYLSRHRTALSAERALCASVPGYRSILETCVGNDPVSSSPCCAVLRFSRFHPFYMISRSTASASSIAPAMAPAVVLILSPLFLGSTITWLQCVLVAFLLIVTLYPIRNSIAGIDSTKTIFFMIVAAVGNGATTVLSRCWRKKAWECPRPLSLGK